MTTPRAPHSSLLLAVLLTGIFMANVDTAIVNVAAPSIRAGLRATGGEVQFVVAGYILAYAMLLITGARLGDIHGYGRVFIVGTAVFTVASLACGLAPNAVVLVLARIVQGAGAALMVAQVLSGIQLNFSGRERASAIGSYAIALSVGAVAGQILGGVILSANLFGAGWRPVFLINVPIGLALMAAAHRLLPMHRSGRKQRLDLWGVATLSIAVLLAVVPLILGRDQHWPAWTWISLLVSLPAATVFVALERRIATRGGDPLVNLHILARPAVAWGLIAAGVSLGAYFGMLFVLALYLQQGLGKTPLYSGLALVAWVAAFGISGPILKRMRPARIPLLSVIGFIILTAAYLSISLSLLVNQTGDALLITLLGVGGLGLGLGRNSAITHITTSVADRYAADISGLINTNSQICGVVGVALFGTLYLSIAPRSGRDAAIHAFTIVNAAWGLAASLAALAAFRAIRGATPTARPSERKTSGEAVPAGARL
ncbi:MAG: MFS transporter [Dehalococcoidia bacterium]